MRKLITYLKKRVKAINSILEKPADEYSTRTFHELRVEIKKVKALFDLINHCSEEFEFEKHFNPFKKIYKQAGKVRDLQLEEQLLDKYQSFFALSEYRSKLSSKLLEEEISYFTTINQDIIDQLDNKFKKLTSLLDQIHKKDVNSYLEKKRKNIQKLLSEESLKAYELHNLRKQIKIYDYNQKSFSSKKKYHPTSNYDQLSIYLGKWHDCQVFINHLNIITEAGKLKSEEILQIENLRSKISSRRKRLFCKIEDIILQISL